MNNEDQIETLFNAHYEALHRYAFTIVKDADEAKDIVQSVFLNVWEKRQAISINTSAKSYLFRSVYNQSINHLKKDAARIQQNALLAREMIPETPEHSEEETQELIKQKINNILDQLPPQCRQVFVKSRAERKKYTEIAAEMGIAVKTVEAHMTHALKLIRKILRVLVVVLCLITDLNICYGGF